MCLCSLPVPALTCTYLDKHRHIIKNEIAKENDEIFQRKKDHAWNARTSCPHLENTTKEQAEECKGQRTRKSASRLCILGMSGKIHLNAITIQPKQHLNNDIDMLMWKKENSWVPTFRQRTTGKQGLLTEGELVFPEIRL